MICDSTLVVSSEVNQVVTDNQETIIVEQPDSSLLVTDNPFFILTLEEVNDIIVVEGIGPKGDIGNSADKIRKNPTYSYDTDGNLVLVEYPDGSYKAFTYVNSVLTRIDYLLDGEIGTRLFIYSGDTLQRIEDN